MTDRIPFSQMRFINLQLLKLNISIQQVYREIMKLLLSTHFEGHLVYLIFYYWRLVGFVLRACARCYNGSRTPRYSFIVCVNHFLV